MTFVIVQGLQDPWHDTPMAQRGMSWGSSWWYCHHRDNKTVPIHDKCYQGNLNRFSTVMKWTIIDFISTLPMMWHDSLTACRPLSASPLEGLWPHLVPTILNHLMSCKYGLIITSLSMFKGHVFYLQVYHGEGGSTSLSIRCRATNPLTY